jgi:hypothetical protein
MKTSKGRPPKKKLMLAVVGLILINNWVFRNFTTKWCDFIKTLKKCNMILDLFIL